MSDPLYKRINQYRIIPRLAVALYGYMCLDAYLWFTALADPTTQQVTLVSTIWGAAAGWFGFYVKSGSND